MSSCPTFPSPLVVAVLLILQQFLLPLGLKFGGGDATAGAEGGVIVGVAWIEDISDRYQI